MTIEEEGELPSVDHIPSEQRGRGKTRLEVTLILTLKWVVTCNWKNSVQHYINKGTFSRSHIIKVIKSQLDLVRAFKLQFGQ